MCKIAIIITLISVAITGNSQNEFENANNKIAIELYHQLKNHEENLFFSPVSIDLALLIAYEGSFNLTKKEFEKVLHTDEWIDSMYKNELINNLISVTDKANYLNISNSIWINKNFNIKEDYKLKIKENYLADMYSIDFNNSARSAEIINDWVSDKTNKLIKEIINQNEINETTRLIISNAIYFIGRWQDEFDKSLTKEDDFYSIGRNTDRIEFMNKTRYLDYFENNNTQAVTIPYKDINKAFCIILPKNRYEIDNIEKSFNYELYDTIIRNLKNVRVKLTMPKFKLETSYLLNKSLQNMGLKTAFTSEADFSGITSQEQLMISGVNHKAYIKIDEEKTEAAAVTSIQLTGTAFIGEIAEPVEFKADHPFIFMILDTQTKGIYFIGRFVKPTQIFKD